VNGPIALLVWVAYGALVLAVVKIALLRERRKEERQMQRNMEEHRIRCNRRSIIADMERGEW
jgi:hypothetical protein